MKRCIGMVCLALLFPIWVQAETSAESQTKHRMDVSLYLSTSGEISSNFVSQWSFPFLNGEHPLTSGNNINFKLDAALSPIWAGLTGDAELTVAPFLSFTLGGQIGTGWNYDLFGKLPLVGLGLNRKLHILSSEDSEVIGHGFDGVLWDLHAGAMLQFDLAAIVPGDWNHVVFQVYNTVQYLAYSRAGGDDLWFYLGDGGLNRNAFKHKFTCFVGYMMPIFLNLAGVQFEGKLPFYNAEIGTDISDIGYEFDLSVLTNFKITKKFSIMTIACFSNGLADPITDVYEREWGFDRVRFIATWRLR